MDLSDISWGFTNPDTVQSLIGEREREVCLVRVRISPEMEIEDQQHDIIQQNAGEDILYSPARTRFRERIASQTMQRAREQ